MSASPGIEGGAGANAPVAAPNVGALAGAAAGSPFHSRAEAATAVRTADLLILTFLFLIMIGGYHVQAMLTMGDWDFWVDWKDRRMWPTVLP
ncbi:MAG: methane monooxygenase/ammonia monooxygenase subunit A, partial [Methylocella sp.]